ncbi:MAG: hypothetical protein E7631_04595 [Ruminococcaceae bacterium]|nr:hypothetical protein [Oscillospiraceae bacterium]
MELEKQTELLREILEAGFAGGESLTSLREKLGIDGETWERWLRDGGMPGDIVSLARAMAEMCAPWVWSSLLGLTKEGSIPAMKLYFDLCRERAPASVSGMPGDREVAMLRREILETAGSVPKEPAELSEPSEAAESMAPEEERHG